jgi:RNA polymerase sigma factor (sigma-70 family)
MKKFDENKLITQSLNGDQKALEQLLVSVQDLVFNISLRMLGTINDAQDASQDIMIKIITNLSSFKQVSSFSTWVYRLSINSLLNYRKSFFSKQQLSFETFSLDISKVDNEVILDTINEFEKEELAYELKLSCSNVMLQCLDPQSRCIFILGAMFSLDSKTAGEIMDITPELYRKRLSRSRQKMSEFMSEYCGLAKGKCSCNKRVGYAIKQQRLNTQNLEYSNLPSMSKDVVLNNIDAMEAIDVASDIYSHMKKYSSPQQAKDFLLDLLNSKPIQIIQKSN